MGAFFYSSEINYFCSLKFLIIWDAHLNIGKPLN